MNTRRPFCNSSQHPCDCCSAVRRRDFLATMGLAALGATSIATGPRAEAVEATAAPNAKPRVRVAFVRQAVDKYFMGWPGAAYDIKARQAEYTRILRDAAKRLGVELDLTPEPIADLDAMNALVTECGEQPPDGVLLISMCLNTSWDKINHFVKRRPPALPTIVYSPMGTSFLNDVQLACKEAEGTKTFVASTQSVEWLAFALQMFNTLCQMKRTRICVVHTQPPKDILLEKVGATLHYVNFNRFSDEYAKVKPDDEVRAMADLYARNAQSTVEPTPQDMLEAAKMYVVCRRLMDAEHCQGIAVHCLPHVKGKTTPPPCLAFSRLNDEGRVAACQADWPAALSLRLVWLLLDQPGFMQNISVDTVDNMLIGAHCTSPLRLDGPEKPAAPFALRSHAESDLGVATQVFWPVDREITIMKFSDARWYAAPEDEHTCASSILLGSGSVVRNIDNPPSVGCRTSLEIEVDNVDDVRSLHYLHHQLFVLGDHKQKFKAYCELAGIETQSI